MSVSIEALAMAGVDCIEYGFYVEDWNHNGNSSPPPHLLADDGDCDGRCQKLLNVGDQSWLLKCGLRFMNITVKEIVRFFIKATMEMRKRLKANSTSVSRSCFLP